jgi:hypothetical protein
MRLPLELIIWGFVEKPNWVRVVLSAVSFSGIVPIDYFFDAVGEFKRITGKQHFKAASILTRCKDLPFP